MSKIKPEVIKVRPMGTCDVGWIRVGESPSMDLCEPERNLLLRGIPPWGTRMRYKGEASSYEFTLRGVLLERGQFYLKDGSHFFHADLCTPIDPKEEKVERAVEKGLETYRESAIMDPSGRHIEKAIRAAIKAMEAEDE